MCVVWRVEQKKVSNNLLSPEVEIRLSHVRFQVLTAASMKIRFALMMEAARTSETSVDNYFTRQYIPEDKSEF
jgi:hypothetical protein